MLYLLILPDFDVSATHLRAAVMEIR